MPFDQIDLAANLLVLAEAPGGVLGAPGAGDGAALVPDGSGGQGGAQQPAPGLGGPFFWVILLLIPFMFIMTAMSGRKERKRKQELLGGLKRNDRVMMTGGMIGSITEVAGDEVTIQVDDTTKTRIRFAKSAVQTVLKSAAGGGAGVKDDAKVETVEPARA